jgi:hypothetical protein
MLCFRKIKGEFLFFKIALIAACSPFVCAAEELEHNKMYCAESFRAGSTQEFSLTIPEFTHSAMFLLTGGVGSEAIYIKQNEAPNRDDYDYKSRYFSHGNFNLLRIINPRPGRHIVLIRAEKLLKNINLYYFHDYISSYTPNVIDLTKQSPFQQTWRKKGQFSLHAIDVPEGQSTLTLALTSDSGDADMIAKFHSTPTSKTDFDAKSDNFLTDEKIIFTNPKAGRYFIRVDAYSFINNLKLVADYTPAVDH